MQWALHKAILLNACFGGERLHSNLFITKLMIAWFLYVRRGANTVVSYRQETAMKQCLSDISFEYQKKKKKWTDIQTDKHENSISPHTVCMGWGSGGIGWGCYKKVGDQISIFLFIHTKKKTKKKKKRCQFVGTHQNQLAKAILTSSQNMFLKKNKDIFVCTKNG